VNTARDLYVKGRSQLKHLEDPELEARLLVCHALSLSSEAFFSQPERSVSSREKRFFREILDRRLSGIPLAYITGQKEFWSTKFYVRTGVLIPRPETEHIVERVIDLAGGKVRGEPKPVIADIGTGSGCIAVTLGMEFPGARIYATDVSPRALQIAAINSDIRDLLNISFHEGDLFKPLEELKLQGKCDFIVSNPPYVTRSDWETLDREIREFEPREALVSGETGLEVIERLIQGAPAYLTPGEPETPGSGGYLIFEIGYGQREAVLRLFEEKGGESSHWAQIVTYPDLAAIPRVVVCQIM
jgi:release factor glutamine methyltransferase